MISSPWFLLLVGAVGARGEDYRRYQQEVSLFVPLPPR
jgi:steroid 5-alpha reductase family enzyme